MLTVIFAITSFICAFGWLITWAAVQILAALVAARGAPTEEEMESAKRRAKRNLFRAKK